MHAEHQTRVHGSHGTSLLRHPLCTYLLYASAGVNPLALHASVNLCSDGKRGGVLGPRRQCTILNTVLNLHWTFSNSRHSQRRDAPAADSPT
jgi:hypothetical protein